MLEWVSLVRIGRAWAFDSKEIAAEALWQIAKGFTRIPQSNGWN
jgi:hypothetical protein